MNHTVQQLKSQSELWGRGELKISDQKEIILRWRTEKGKKREHKELFADLELLWLVLFFNQHLQAQLIPIFLHVTQLLVLLPVFPWVYKFIFHWKCGAQANLEKHLSLLVLLKTCLCPQENQHMAVERGVIQWKDMPALLGSPSTNTSIS